MAKKIFGSTLRTLSALVLSLLLNSIESLSQSHGGEYGVFIRAGGHSAANNGPASPLNNQITEFVNGFVETGVFGYFPIRRDTLDKPFRYLRIDLGLASRTGTFDLWNGGVARMTSASVDLTPMLPIRSPVLKGIDAYLALGPVFSYRLRRNIISDQLPPPEATTGSGFKMGIAFELGFRIGYSFIGYHLMTEFNDYPCRASAVTFGFNIPDRWKKKRKG
jgi:hypothetical protein